MGAKTLLTVEQIERLPEPEGFSYELDQGELVEVPSASYLHNRIRDRLTRRLLNHLDAHPQNGAVVAEQWFRLGMDTVRAPDVAVIGPDRIARIEPEKRIQSFAPRLAIEITSPSNTFDELARKTRQYVEAGGKAVWILVTAMQEVHVYPAGSRPRIFSADEVLEDAALLPGFSVRVSDLFDLN